MNLQILSHRVGGLTYRPHRLHLKDLGIPTSGSSWHGHLRFQNSFPFLAVIGFQVNLAEVSVTELLEEIKNSENTNGSTAKRALAIVQELYRLSTTQHLFRHNFADPCPVNKYKLYEDEIQKQNVLKKKIPTCINTIKRGNTRRAQPKKRTKP